MFNLWLKQHTKERSYQLILTTAVLLKTFKFIKLSLMIDRLSHIKFQFRGQIFVETEIVKNLIFQSKG